ncbi:MAG: SPOR domain-containing protein [Candidatus Azobacteroides sp.]|nr:SPOR domain-containing protein [Candidatus Azobacteroides sp.]
MRQLILHTEYLLSIHPCVIIPGLGGFLSHISPARFEESVSTWYPPQKQLSFNSSLFHNDGLLLDSYSQTYSVSYSEAFVMVEKAVLELKRELKKSKEVEFGRIGNFRYDENGALLFSPAESLQPFSSSTYGMQPVKLPLLEDLKKSLITYNEEELPGASPNVIEHPAKRKDTIYIPLKKRFLYRTVGVIAIVTLFMLFSTPIYVDNTHATNYAKVLTPLITGIEGNQDPSMWDMNATDLSEAALAVAEPVIEESISVSVVEETSVKEIIPETVPENKIIEQPVIATKDNFYIIIGSFPNNKDAQKYVAIAKANGLSNAGVVVKDNRYRVYAEVFDNRAEANQYMNNFKVSYQNTHPNAWLYKEK